MAACRACALCEGRRQTVFGVGNAIRPFPWVTTNVTVSPATGRPWGAAEAIAVVCSLRDQALHPSLNVDHLDPAFDLDLIRERRSADVRYALSSSAGFGGHNGSIILGPPT